MSLLVVVSVLLLASAFGLEAQVGFHVENTLSTRRLVQFNETVVRYMTQEEVVELASQCRANGIHGGFMDITDNPNLSPAGLKVDLSDIKYPTEMRHVDYVKSLFGTLSLRSIQEYAAKLSSFHTRYYTTDTGLQAAQWIQSEFERIAAQYGRFDIKVDLFPHTWKQPSVVARIPGSDPKLTNEIIVIGAHEDSINGGGTKRSPGADDDASGTCTVLETFRNLVSQNFRPQRTVEFQTYAGEELGLLGSQAIASNYQKAQKKVVAMMQIDMAWYTAGSATPTVGVITDFVNVDLTSFLRKVITTYTNLKFTDTKCGYGCSDHASWTRAGYASCFPFESAFSASNPYIHTDKDDVSRLNFDYGMEFLKIPTGFAVELGNVK